jgi:glutamine---fructose-6-phosphate transaminase (isomerizing)
MEMLSNILSQPDSIESVVVNQSGLDRAAAAIRGARRVIVSGMGASLYGAMQLAQHIPAITIEASELLHYNVEAARDAAVVLVSRSGETVEVVNVIPKLRAVNATIIGITNEPGTTLAREADVAVLVNSGKDEAVAVQSYTGTAMLMLLLAAAVTRADVAAEASRVPAKMSETIAAARELSWEWLRDLSQIYVLGRGPSLASAYEGALLFNETAKLPSVPISSGNFRHGPVEVVDATFGAFVFATDPRTRSLDEALAAHIQQRGGRVHVVSAEPGYFAPVVEIVPLQFAAYHLALMRGVTPGQFRYISLVTTSETDLK